MIGWLLGTNVTAEIISTRGFERMKEWAANHDEATLYLSILTIAEYDKRIANLPDEDPRRVVYMNTRDSLAARFAARLLPVIPAICHDLGDMPASTLYQYLHADGSSKAPGRKMLDADIRTDGEGSPTAPAANIVSSNVRRDHALA